MYGTSLSGHFWRFVLGSKKTANFNLFKFPVALAFTILHGFAFIQHGEQRLVLCPFHSLCVLLGDFQTLAGVFEIRFFFHILINKNESYSLHLNSFGDS